MLGSEARVAVRFGLEASVRITCGIRVEVSPNAVPGPSPNLAECHAVCAPEKFLFVSPEAHHHHGDQNVFSEDKE